MQATSHRAPSRFTNFFKMPSASLYGLAALETPRIIGKTKTVVFDAQMYMGPDQPPLTANLQYFNEQSLNFGDVGVYFIHATVCLMLLEA